MEVFGLPTEQLLFALSQGTRYKYTSTNHVYNTLQQYKKVLILDFRSPEAFHKAHFVFSVNIPQSSVTAEEFMEYDPAKFVENHFSNLHEKELFAHRKRLMVFLIPAHGSTQYLADNPLLLSQELALDPTIHKSALVRTKGYVLSCLAYKALSKEKVRELYILQEGFKELVNRFPFLCEFCCNKIYLEPKRKSYPNEILKGKLYIGDQFDASDPVVMKNLKITHVVNVTSEIPNHFEKEGITYMRVVVQDRNESKIHYYFPRVYGFIDSAIFSEEGRKGSVKKIACKEIVKKVKAEIDFFSLAKKSFVYGLLSLLKKKEVEPMEKSPEEIEKEFNDIVNLQPDNQNRVLVHCAMGISRSSSIVIMYLMKKFNASFESALAFVKSGREIVEPNDGFREQLVQFEKSKYSFIRALELCAPSCSLYTRKVIKGHISGTG